MSNYPYNLLQNRLMINNNDDDTPNLCNNVNVKGRHSAITLKFLSPVPNLHSNNNNDDATKEQ